MGDCVRGVVEGGCPGEMWGPFPVVARPPLDGTVLTASVHCNDAVELAPKVGALLVALEHRYYGTSIPV